MSRVDGLIRRFDKTLTRFNPIDVTIYKRVNESTGGDALLGRAGSTSFTDTLLDPQPIYQRLGRNIVGNSAPSQKLLVDTSTSHIAADYQIIFSPTSITREELDNNNITYVMKDALGALTIYHLTDYEVVAMQGEPVMFVGYVRSAVR